MNKHIYVILKRTQGITFVIESWENKEKAQEALEDYISLIDDKDFMVEDIYYYMVDCILYND